MIAGYLLFVLAVAKTALGQFPQNVCSQAGIAWCVGYNYISRCEYGGNSTAVVGNCNDNLADVPPFGVKNGAPCWQSNDTAGDAQCTYDCVAVTAANGTTFYPVGCTRGTALPNNTATAAPLSTSLSYAPTTGPSITSLSITAAGSPSQSATKTATSNVEPFCRAHAFSLKVLVIAWVILFS